DQTGDRADHDAVEDDPAYRHLPATVGRRRRAWAAEHGNGRGGHHEREGDQEPTTGDELGEPTSPVGTDHAGSTEDETDTPLYAASAGVGDGTRGAGDPDDEQGHRDRGLRILAGDIDQDRDGDDRATAAEQAERHA